MTRFLCWVNYLNKKWPIIKNEPLQMKFLLFFWSFQIASVQKWTFSSREASFEKIFSFSFFHCMRTSPKNGQFIYILKIIYLHKSICFYFIYFMQNLPCKISIYLFVCSNKKRSPFMKPQKINESNERIYFAINIFIF